MTHPLPLPLRLRAFAALVVIPPLLSLVSFARLSTWLDGYPGVTGRPSAEPAALASWVDRWLYALPWPWRHTCLKRAAVLYYLLRRAGRPVELRLGVRRDPFGAHAWLVLAGEPYLERDPSQSASHAVIARFPEAAS